MPRFKEIIPFLIVMVLFFGVSCSKKQEVHEVSESGSLRFSVKEKAEIAFDNSSVDCLDPKECPDYTGLLILSYKEVEESIFGDETFFNVSVCSQQLVAPDMILTNRHCIPELIANKGEDCSEYIKFKFPKTENFDKESIGCKRVLDISAPDTNQDGRPPWASDLTTDWAILQLERSSQRPLPEKSLDGIKHATQFTAYPIIFSTSYFQMESGEKVPYANSAIKKVNCTTMMDSVFSLFYNHKFSSTFLAQCDFKLIGGSSGSGVYIDEKLKGVISFAVSGGDIDLYVGPASTRVKNKFTGGSNLACIPFFNSSPNSLCAMDDSIQAQNLGQQTSWLYGIKPSENQKLEMTRITNASEDVKWVRNDMSYFSEAMLVGYYLNSLSPDYQVLGRSIERQSIFTSYPYTPSCVHSRLKDELPFNLQMPFFKSDVSIMTLNDLSQISVPVEINYYSYVMKFDPKSQKFKGSLQRLGGNHFLNYMEQKAKRSNAIRACVFSGVRDDAEAVGCNAMRQIMNRFKKFKESTGIEESIFNNEDLVGEYPLLEKIELPICEELGAQ